MWYKEKKVTLFRMDFSINNYIDLAVHGYFNSEVSLPVLLWNTYLNMGVVCCSPPLLLCQDLYGLLCLLVFIS